MEASFKRLTTAVSLAATALLIFGAGVAAAGGRLTVAPGITVAYPDGWSVGQQRYTNAQELVTAAGGRVLITADLRQTHAEALQQLRDIASESTTAPSFLTLCGWPALQRRYLVPMEQPGLNSPEETPELSLRVTVAAAVDRTVVRLQGFVPPGGASEIADQIEAIGRSLSCTATSNPQQVNRELEELRGAPSSRAPLRSPLRKSERLAQQPAPSPETVQGGAAALPGLAMQVQGGVGEIEVAVSTNGQYVVMAANSGYAYSSNGGGSFTAVGGGTPLPPGYFDRNGDPSLGFGVSGSFYYAFIAAPTGAVGPPFSWNSCSTAVGRSTDNGQTFGSYSNATLCVNAGTACFPDQHHIAADRFNAAGGGGDQVYSVWRNFSGGNCNSPAGPVITSLVCSQDSGATWSAVATVVEAGADYPRLTVGQDGFVYVVYHVGGNIRLNKFSSCSAGLVQQAGFPVNVSAYTDVTCPVPGLDRCNNGNRLSSWMVAVDDTNANHVFVAFASNTAAGNEDVFVTDDPANGGAGPWSAPLRINTNTPGRRFMPWACAQLGAARVGWYDRRAAGPTNDLTDFYCGSASRVGGVLTAGTETNVSNNPDPQCASGWPCAPRSTNDSESCTTQPQLAGVCRANCASPAGTDSRQRCDFSDGGCPPGETCCTGGGCPKYGDYSGIGCAAGRVYTAWSSATAPPGLPNPGGLAIFFDSKAAAAPDLSVTKSDVSDPVIAGNNLTYTITVTNGPTVAALTVGWTDTTPVNTTFQGLVSPPGWTCNTPAVGAVGAITCSKAFVATSEVAVFGLTVGVNANTPDATVLSNTVLVSSQEVDGNPGDNSDTETTAVITRADLSTTKGAGPNPVIAGTDLTYIVVTTNNGPSDAQTVQLSDPLPANTTFVSATPSAGGACVTPAVGANGTVTCTWVGATTPTQGRSVLIVAHVLPSAPDGSTITNTGTASSATTDPDSSNDAGVSITDVITRADLAITKNDTPDPVIPGQTLIFTIIMTNNGPSDAQNATLTENVPANTTFQAVFPPAGWGCVTPPVGGTGVITCTTPTMPFAATANFVVRVRVNNGVPNGTNINNTVTASSDTIDPDESNNPSSTDTRAFIPVPTLGAMALLASILLVLMMGRGLLYRRRS